MSCQKLRSVVPTRGAIVRANYDGNIGQRAFVHLKTASGQDALWRDGSARRRQQIVNIVSDAGMVYMSGLQQTDPTSSGAKRRAAVHASFTFYQPGKAKASGISQIETVCR